MNPAAASPPKRTQRERSQATTEQLVGAARELFARDGYAATSLDAVCEAAKVTKGALYHHFDGKRELFEAVFRAEQQVLCDALAGAYAKKKDPWAGFSSGSRAFVRACLDQGVQQITLLDAPSVLGWERMREIEADYGLALMKSGLNQAMDAGQIRRRDVTPLAHVLFGGLCEAVMFVARSEDQKAAMRQVVRELNAVLDGLAT